MWWRAITNILVGLSGVVSIVFLNRMKIISLSSGILLLAGWLFAFYFSMLVEDENGK